jgi:hypothetical protein
MNIFFSIGFFFMKNAIAIFVALLVGTVMGIAQPMTDIRIVNEDQRSIVLEFTPNIRAEHVTGNQGTIFTRFMFSESQTAYDSAGRTDFIRPILLLLPSPQYSLQVLASEYQTRDTVKLLPKPTMKAHKDFGFIESYDDTSYSRTILLPKQNVLAELNRVGKTSIGYVGTLLLHPVQAIDKEKVRVYSRIVVRIDFKNTFSTGLFSSCLLRGQLPNKVQLSKMEKISSKQAAGADSPLWKGDWYRIEVTKTGMYKLDYTYLKNLNSAISDINSIRLYGNGGLTIPDNNTDPRPNTLLEISRLVVDQNSNGILEPGDYVIFYGRAVRGWSYSGGNNFTHYLNPYSEKNYYFLTFNQGIGKQMDTLSASAVSPSPIKPTSFQEKIFVEDELFNLQNSGRLWAGELFTGSDVGTYNRPLPGLVASSRIDYHFRLFHKSSTRSDKVEVFENDQSLKTVVLDASGSTSSFAGTITFNTLSTGKVSGDESKIKIQTTGSQDSKTWLDWIEIFYERRLEAVNDVLLFTTIDRSSGLYQYDISNLSGGTHAFEVTDHNNVKELKFASVNPAICQIQIQQTEGIIHEIAIIGENGYITPAAAIKIENTINLHNAQSQYDFVIISPAEFLSSANQLKAHREAHDNLRTLVVDINHIYNEFSSGIPDILAIREFIRYTQDNWMSSPRYFLLLGWGHFDYKNISSSQRNWIPPYEPGSRPEESLNIIDYTPNDDKFTILDPLDDIYSVAIGRIPARSAQEASVAVNKIISYESYSFTDSSAWRNVLTFIADDGLTSEADEGDLHTSQMEGIAESTAAKSFDARKIYIIEYPTVNSSSGRRKPNANEAIDDAINQGTLFTAYVGHGNEQLLAHEQIFVQDADLPKLTNRERLTFFSAATCNFSRYDDPSILSIGEQLVTMEQGGAIGTLGAVRSSYPIPNVALAQDFFNYLFTKDTSGRNPRIGDAAWYAKYRNTDVVNTQKYHLFCDPTLRLLIPENISSIDSVGGKPTSDLITIKSLAHVPIKGIMKQNTGTIMTSFQGKGLLQVFDSRRSVHIREGAGDFYFMKNGSLLYRGGVTFQGGNFKATVPIPKDVAFGNQSRISIYAWDNATDGTGYTENVMIEGIDSVAASNIDTVGPKISIYLNDLDFRSGDVIKNNPTLIVKFQDESGINTSTAGVGHQLSAAINNPNRTLNLSNYYQSDFDTYKSGEVRCLINDLNEGEYTLRVKAWDIQNNSSEAEIYFTISLVDDLRLLNVVNYPNPFSNSTTFTFQRIGTDPINVDVKIYSIAGRLIGKMTVQNIMDRSVRIPWDGRDNDGDVLANGIYLYKLIVRSLDGQRTSEAIGKLAVIH